MRELTKREIELKKYAKKGLQKLIDDITENGN